MVLVVGGTGDLGARVVRGLIAAGESVRCLVRASSDDRPLLSLGASTVRGDLADAESLRRVCEAGEGVVATATAIARILAGAKRPTLREVDQDGMLALVEAAERAGVSRFVYVSFAAAERGLGSPLERAKLAVERRLARSTLPSVIVRPDAFQEVHLAPVGRFDIAGGRVAVIGKGDTRRRWVSTADVAALVCAVSVEPDPPRMLELGGPEALTRNEAIAVAEQASGRAIRRQRMPRPVARVAVRVLSPRYDALASVFAAGLHQDLVPATWDDGPLRQRGISPRSASDFIREQARGG